MIRTRMIVASTVLFMSAAAVPAFADTNNIDFIAKQQTTEWLATDLVGLTVENPAGEELGDINDLVLGKDGQVVGAVVGVGGFLGMGEKNVAIPFGIVETKTADDETIVLLNTTREALEGAPDYADTEGKPLSLSKRLTDEASETYEKAKETASETYNQAKDQASKAYNKAKETASDTYNQAEEAVTEDDTANETVTQ